jgi:hypothetical protein
MKRLTLSASVVISILLLVTPDLCLPVAGEEFSGQGKWQSQSGETMAGTWSALLHRSGADVEGTIELTGSSVLSTAAVSGTIENGQIALDIFSEGVRQATFSGKIDGESISGKWEYPAINDQGMWTGTLTSK